MKIMKSPLRLIGLIGGVSIFFFVISCKHDKGVAPTTVQKWSDLPM
jgi:hypothetical protein